MKYILLILLLAIIGCKKIDKEIATYEQYEKKNITKIPPYKEFLASVNKKTKREKENYLFDFINNDIPKYWINTPWSFNGTSREPQKESIACGYFVTNILDDYGFSLNRIRLAQQPSSVMIKSLCKDIKHFTKIQDLEQYILSKNKNQVYIVGLDFHTGFLTRGNNDIYFIHSNYINNKGVVKEMIKTSQALNASETYMVGTLNY